MEEAPWSTKFAQKNKGPCFCILLFEFLQAVGSDAEHFFKSKQSLLSVRDSHFLLKTWHSPLPSERTLSDSTLRAAGATTYIPRVASTEVDKTAPGRRFISFLTHDLLRKTRTTHSYRYHAVVSSAVDEARLAKAEESDDAGRCKMSWVERLADDRLALNCA